MEALEDSGMPFSYFPVMMPHARGDHVIAPTPVGTETGTVRLKINVSKGGGKMRHKDWSR